MSGDQARVPTFDELLELVRRLTGRVEQLEREKSAGAAALRRERERNLRLQEENRKLRESNDRLQQAVKRQAAPFSKGKPKPNPRRPGRKPVPDYGAKAFRKPPAKVDETLEAPLPCRCPDCHGEIEFVEVQEQFQEEVTRQPTRRRINVAIGRCRNCKRRVQGRHALQTSDALGAAASQLGPDAQALAVHLNKDLGLSHGKIARFFFHGFGITLSRGGSAQLMLRAAKRSEPSYQSILMAVRKSAVVNPDETGWKVAGLLQWLWTFVTESATAYLIRPSRAFEVAAEVLGEDYSGVLGHDGWSPYDLFSEATHQQCLEHILRRCRQILEVATRGAVRFPRQVKRILQDALLLRDRRDEEEISRHGLSVAIGRLEHRMDRLLTWRRTDPVNERLAKHLDAHRNQLFTFLRHPEVEATNWPAEQAIRPAVVNRKVWGGNRTDAGASAQATLTSVLRTCAQRGRDGIEFLSKTLRARTTRNLPRIFPLPAPS